MKRILGTLLAVLALVLGAALAALGALGIAVFGVQGATTGTSATLESADTSLAIVADLERVDVGIPFAELVGSPTLTVTGSSGDSVFVGTAPQGAVDEYLFGAPYDLATKGASWTLAAVPGIQTSLEEPGVQDFWTQQSLGTTADIELQVGADPTTLVVMNADATPGVDVNLVLGFEGRYIFYYSIAAIVVGVLLIAIGIALLVRGRRGRGGPSGTVVDISEDAQVTSFFGSSAPLASEERTE